MTRDGSFIDLLQDLDGLESFAVAIRYPGVIVSVQAAEEAFSSVERVRKFIRGKLEQ